MCFLSQCRGAREVEIPDLKLWTADMADLVSSREEILFQGEKKIKRMVPEGNSQD